VTSARPENPRRLWLLAAGPLIWALHFLVSYGIAAIWCAKRAGDGDLTGARLAIAGLSLVALLAVAVLGWPPVRRWSARGPRPDHAIDSALARDRFLDFATSLLAGLSAVAILFETLAIVFVKDCR
jgi:hypothetical protein